MNMNPTIELLNDAKHEILSLRRQNEILRAKVEVMDLFACVLHTQPAQREQGMAIDVAWQLDKEIDRLKSEQPTTV
jgi:sulfate adenylyltransferase subunit 1 (EFTu-like GTPase family)